MKLFARENQSDLPRKYDGVIEAVRYAPDGTLSSVRIYERRGPTWSDRLIISREEVVKRIRSGKKFVTGERKEFLASTFAVKSRVQLLRVDGKERLVSGGSNTSRDQLDAPLF